MNFNQASVFVTGTNRGIGRAFLDELQEKGVKRIYAAARRTEDLGDVAGDLIVPVKLDITDLEQVKAAAELASDATVLINNAGILTSGSLLD